MKKPERSPLFASAQPVVGQRCVHLDLKGTPPSSERLLSLLKMFSAARYNSILVEWEDAFPWTVDERFRSETAYSPDVVRKFAAAALRTKVSRSSRPSRRVDS